MKLKYFIFLIVLVFGCQSVSQIEHGEELFDRLVGHWQLVDNPVIESWIKTDSSYIGEVFVVVDADTVKHEELSCHKINGDMYYTAIVVNQNEGTPIPFKMISCEDDYIVFENSKHDFPKIIEYEIIDANNMRTIIRENKGPESKSIESFYYRLNTN